MWHVVASPLCQLGEGEKRLGEEWTGQLSFWNISWFHHKWCLRVSIIAEACLECRGRTPGNILGLLLKFR